MTKFLPQAYSVRIFCLVLLGLVLLSPSLFAGLMADDFWHALWLTSPIHNPIQTPLSFFNLFSFADTDTHIIKQQLSQGALTWWASPDLSVKFWRPIAELSHLDYRLFLNTPSMLHLHNLLWYGAFLFLLAAFYRRIFPHKHLVYWALLFVICEPFHAISVSWLANRNILMAASFAMACLIFYYDYRQQGRFYQLIAALSCLLLSLLSSEAGASSFAFLFAFALFLDKKPKALLSLWPFALTIILWFGLYKSLGYGAYGDATMYLSPSARPLDFLVQYLQRLPFVFALQISVFPKLWPAIFSPQILIMSGCILLAVCFYGLLRFKNRLLGFALTAFMIAMLPLAAALLHERNFIFISAVIAPILALLADFLWQKSKSALVLLVLLRVFITGALVPLACLYMMFINGKNISAANTLPKNLENQTVFIIGMPLMQSSFIYPTLKLEHRPTPANMFNLTSNAQAKVQKINQYTWQISDNDGVLSKEDDIFRDLKRRPLHTGQSFLLAGATLTIIKTNALGNATTIKLQWPARPNHNYRIYCWQKNRLNLCPADQ